MARYIDEEKLIVNLMDYSKGKKTIGQCVTDTPTEDIVSIKEIINEIDELYYDFENSDGNLTTFIIDGETLHTDVGYAIVGIEFYKNILKKRIGKTYKIQAHTLGIKNGVTEELMKVKNEIVELSHNGEIATVDRYKVEKIIDDHITALEKGENDE